MGVHATNAAIINHGTGAPALRAIALVFLCLATVISMESFEILFTESICEYTKIYILR